MTKVTDYTLPTGDSVAVSVDTLGIFRAEFKGKAVEAETLNALYDKLERRAKEKRIRISVLVGLDGGDLSNVTVTGLKANDNDIALVRTSDGTADQERSHRPAYQPWTDETRADYKRLEQAARDATRAFEEYKKARRYHLDPSTPKQYGLTSLAEIVRHEVKRQVEASTPPKGDDVQDCAVCGHRLHQHKRKTNGAYRCTS
jgi:hypothetical protein